MAEHLLPLVIPVLIKNLPLPWPFEKPQLRSLERALFETSIIVLTS